MRVDTRPTWTAGCGGGGVPPKQLCDYKFGCQNILKKKNHHRKCTQVIVPENVPKEAKCDFPAGQTLDKPGLS